MTYAFGTEPVTPVESSPETSRWYKLTPGVIFWLQATRAQDAGVRDLLKRAAAELVFMGVSATGEDLFWLTANESGNMGGDYKAPAASDSPVMTYEQVLRVFEPNTSGPLTKRVFRRAAPNRTGLYIGIAASAAVLLGGVAYWAMHKKAAPAALAASRRRVKRNSSFGPERDRVAAQVRAAFQRGDGAAARRALARLSEIDLALMPHAMVRNSIYAIPEHRAYPIRTAQEAYHAVQRLKQGRVSSETDAKRIITAIQRKYPDVWRRHLAGYPLAKIMASKRRGLEARSRT